MEKLIELLNQFEDTDNWENWYQVKFRESKIISKKFWFIERLVKEDKIDISPYEYKIWIWRIWENNRDMWYDEYSDYEKILMLLSIQDNPIEFLCEILK